MNSIVVHYNELALKGRNRPWFVQMLVRNIRTALAGLSVPTVRSVMGRIQIELGPATWDSVRERLQSVFGIQYFSYAGIAPLDLDQMASTILSRALHEKGVSEDQLVGVLYLLGRCAEQRGQLEQAVEYYQRVFVIDIQFRDVGERLAAVESARS